MLFIQCIFLYYPFLKAEKMNQLKGNKVDSSTLYIRCQLLHVSSSRYHHQGVYQQQSFTFPTSISGGIRPHFNHKR